MSQAAGARRSGSPRRRCRFPRSPRSRTTSIPGLDSQGQLITLACPGARGDFTDHQPVADRHRRDLPDHAHSPGNRRPGRRDRTRRSPAWPLLDPGSAPGKCLTSISSASNGPRSPFARTRRLRLGTLTRSLWGGDYVTHHGNGSRSSVCPDLHPAGNAARNPCRGDGGRSLKELAAFIGDGLDLRSPGVTGKRSMPLPPMAASAPIIGQLTVCWGKDEQVQAELAKKIWVHWASPWVSTARNWHCRSMNEQGMELVTTEKVALLIVVVLTWSSTISGSSSSSMPGLPTSTSIRSARIRDPLTLPNGKSCPAMRCMAGASSLTIPREHARHRADPAYASGA